MKQFLKLHRVALSTCPPDIRFVYWSQCVRKIGSKTLDAFLAEKAPTLYRDLSEVVGDLKSGLSLSSLKDALLRLPTAESFKLSHFGEITAAVFAEEVLGLRRLYSKLSLLTSQNANAFKMDLALYDPRVDPVEFVFGEVKSSPSCSNKSCYSSLLRSMARYGEADLEFDLAAARDRLNSLDWPERERVRKALLPYGNRSIRYLGLVLIDAGTFNEKDAQPLGRRKNDRDFSVELVGIESYVEVSGSVFGRLEKVLEALRSACS